jgi:septum site-determining protein MinD
MSTAPRIVAVCGARDGVGRTTFAVNAALALLKETRSRVLFLDMDMESSGDGVTLLGMDPAQVKSVLDFAPYLNQLQSQQLRQYISAHPAGIGVIPMSRPGADGAVGPEHIERILQLLQPLCDYIVADCGVGVNNTNVKILEKSAGIFCLTLPDLMVMDHTRRFLERLQSLQFPTELVQVVLNRAPPKGPLTPEIVSRRVGRKVMVSIPEETETALAAQLEGKPFVSDKPRARLSRVYDELLRQVVEKGALDRMMQVARPQGVSTAGGGRLADLPAAQAEELDRWQRKRGAKAGNIKSMDPRTQVKLLIHKRMVEAIDMKALDRDLSGKENRDEVLATKVREAVSRILDDVGGHITDRAERQRILKEVVDEALGLEDDRVTEIMVNRRDDVWIEIEGKLQQTGASFTDDAQLLGVIERIVAPIGRRIDEKSPMVDARLKDGSRVNAVIPPLALDGPSLTIRKFSREPLVVKDLVRFGSMTAEIADFLRACVEARLNILISGGTGSGKTTLLNVMSGFIPKGERIVTVEDSAELNLNQPHLVRLESRPPNIEGEGEVAIRDLVRNSLRMRPDRIVIGECRGAEAIDMLQAMNTGHDGSLTTIHSNSPRDCIARLETLVMFAGLELPSKAIREQIGSAINIIVQQSRLSDGSRKITQVSEVTGMEGQTITLQDIFVFKQEGVTQDHKVRGRFMSTGFVPRFVQDLQSRGIKLPTGIFGASQGPPSGRAPRGRR